jgi:lysophospholipase L1-like esterase
MSRSSRILALLLANLALFLLLEGGVRLLAALGAVSLPAGGIHGFDALQDGGAPPEERRLFVLDRDLLVRLRPDFERVYPRLFVHGDGRETYRVRTNAQGFRTPPFASTPAPGVIRVVCLGDSSTFGMNVEEPDSYPRQLASLLEARHPGRFEVLNFGVPGYTSRQGLELLRRDVLALAPDVVTFAFGHNDRFTPRPTTDDEAIRFNQSALGSLVFAMRRGLDRLYLFRLLRKAFARLVQLDYELVVTGDKRSTLENVSENIANAGALLRPLGVPFVVLDADFYGTDVGAALRVGAASAEAPFVDLPGAFEQARRRRAGDLESRLGLRPLDSPAGAISLRVHAPGEMQVFLRSGRYSDPATWRPMTDSGRAPDQLAGDGVWSISVARPARSTFFYAYGRRRGERTEPEPEFRINAFVRDFARRATSGPGPAPLDEFGAGSLMSDETHPDEEGHAIVARRLLREILELDRVRTALRAARG